MIQSSIIGFFVWDVHDLLRDFESKTKEANNGHRCERERDKIFNSGCAHTKAVFWITKPEGWLSQFLSALESSALSSRKDRLLLSAPNVVHTLTWRAYNLLERWIHFNGKRSVFKNGVLVSSSRASWCLSMCLLACSPTWGCVVTRRSSCVNCNYLTNWYSASVCSILLKNSASLNTSDGILVESFHEIIEASTTSVLMIQTRHSRTWRWLWFAWAAWIKKRNRLSDDEAAIKIWLVHS